MENGGETRTGEIDPIGETGLTDVVFDYFIYIDTGADGGAINIGSTNVTTPAFLSGANEVTSAGNFAGPNGQINWTSVAFISPGSPVYNVALTFTSDQPFGTVRVINYLDEDVLGVDNVLVVMGTPGQNNFQLLTIDDNNDVGVAQAAGYNSATGAIYRGWAADEYSDLQGLITGVGTAYSITGEVDLFSLPPYDDPRFPDNDAYGINDITSAIAFDLDPNATSASIVFSLGGSPEIEDCANGIDDDGDGLVDCDDPDCAGQCPEICNDDRDNDFDELVDCDDPDCCDTLACTERTCGESNLIETFLTQQAIMNGVEVSGDFTSTLDFTSLEFVTLTTGPFAGKGFSIGTFETTFEGVPYTGEWNGVSFLRPDERRIYLKGAISGDISATVEGYLTESVPESGNYDKYQATWQIGRLGGTAVSAVISLNGNVTYLSSSEFPVTELYVLQTNQERPISGHYDPYPLSTVLTHLRVVSPDNPYAGEGFSFISYTFEGGSGQGWTYDKLVSTEPINKEEMKGLFSSPLFGIVTGTLLSKTLFLTIERVDLALPPMADLEVRTWGPRRVSPGQTVDYMVEYRNDGASIAEDAVIVLELPSLAQYISSTNEGIYRWETHEAFWKLGTVLPGQRGALSVKVKYRWDLAQGIPQLTLAKYGTSSEDKDYYLNPDREPLFDLQDYLDYQPLAITSEDILTPEEFEEELALDPKFHDLHEYAIELGYSDRFATKAILNDGSTLIVVLMSNSSVEEVFFLTKVNETSHLEKYTENTVSFFDREGGMTWDLVNDSLDSWGEWDQLVSPSETQRDFTRLNVSKDALNV